MWAVCVTSAAAMVTSWVEFSDYGKKTERYTRAVVEIRNLKSRWTCTLEAEKAAPTSISCLVQNGESIISDERIGWLATSNATGLYGYNNQNWAVDSNSLENNVTPSETRASGAAGANPAAMSGVENRIHPA